MQELPVVESVIASLGPSAAWVIIAVLVLLAMLSRKPMGGNKRTID